MMQRVGWICVAVVGIVATSAMGEENTAMQARSTTVESLLPPQTYYALHINQIRHGRQTCQALHPRCELCALQQQCDYFRGDGEWVLR